MLDARAHQAATQLRLAREPLQRRGGGGGVARRHEQAAPAPAKRRRHAADVRSNDRSAGRMCLHEHLR
jgi:hypothetical protein